MAFFIALILFCDAFGQNRKETSIGFIQDWLKNPSKDINQEKFITGLTESEIFSVNNLIRETLSDSIFDVRWNCFSLASVIGAKSNSEALKSEIVSIMFKGMLDIDSRITFIASEYLSEIKIASYSDSQKDTLINLLEIVKNPNILISLYRLCGENSVYESEDLLQNVAFSNEVPFFQRWVALASLTRLGNNEAEEKMHVYLTKVGLSLDAINTLYPYVLLSRSKKNVGYLIDQIMRNENGCESSNPDNTIQIPCAYHVLKVVAPEIEELEWSGENGLENLSVNESLLKARERLVVIGDNWNFKTE
jgi:hypothetical protein